MPRLLPEKKGRKAPISKAEAAGHALKKLETVERLDITNSAKYLQLAYITLKDQVDRGAIPTTFIGKTYYIERIDLEWLKTILEVYGSLAVALKAERALKAKGHLLEEQRLVHNTPPIEEKE